MCAKVKRLGLNNEPGQHNESAFVDGTVRCPNAKALLKKIDKHRDSLAHAKSEQILKQREADDIVNAATAAQSKFLERHRDDIDAMTKVFRTAYKCTKSHLSYSEHGRMIKLQSLNGINCGSMLYSHHACSNIISHISHEMCTEIINYVVQSGAKFSILVDESTAVSIVQSMIVYMRMQFDGDICTYFLGLFGNK